MFKLRFSDQTWEFDRPYLMGVANFTDDSFFPGSRLKTQDLFSQKVAETVPYMDILDLGAESTRPGADSVNGEVELSHLLPKIEYVKKHFPDLKISIDTYKAQVAEACIQAGADLINDISAGEFSQGEMFSICDRYRVPLVLMHKQGTPKTMQDKVSYQDVVKEVHDYLKSRVDLAQEYGLSKDQLLIDVGIGFGKKLRHNLDLLKALPKFKDIGVGMLIGASRKSLLGELTGQPVSERLAGSIGGHLAALTQFCHVIRCHDIREMWDAVQVFFSIVDFEKKTMTTKFKPTNR